MAEAEYWRFTVARDCQKKNTSETHSECRLKSQLAIPLLGGIHAAPRVCVGPGRARLLLLLARPVGGEYAVCILSDFPMYFSFGSPAQQ